MQRSKIPSYIGIFVGIVAVIVSFFMLGSGPSDSLSGMSTGGYTSHSWYGGDAYTGIQQAAADTANNVSTQSGIIKAGFQMVAQKIPSFGALLLFFGLGMICYFAHSLNEINARNAFEAAVLARLTGKPAGSEPPAPAPMETKPAVYTPAVQMPNVYAPVAPEPDDEELDEVEEIDPDAVV